MNFAIFFDLQMKGRKCHAVEFDESWNVPAAQSPMRNNRLSIKPINKLKNVFFNPKILPPAISEHIFGSKHGYPSLLFCGQRTVIFRHKMDILRGLVTDLVALLDIFKGSKIEPKFNSFQIAQQLSDIGGAIVTCLRVLSFWKKFAKPPLWKVRFQTSHKRF